MAIDDDGGDILIKKEKVSLATAIIIMRLTIISTYWSPGSNRNINFRDYNI